MSSRQRPAAGSGSGGGSSNKASASAASSASASAVTGKTLRHALSSTSSSTKNRPASSGGTGEVDKPITNADFEGGSSSSTSPRGRAYDKWAARIETKARTGLNNPNNTNNNGNKNSGGNGQDQGQDTQTHSSSSLSASSSTAARPNSEKATSVNKKLWDPSSTTATATKIGGGRVNDEGDEDEDEYRQAQGTTTSTSNNLDRKGKKRELQVKKEQQKHDADADYFYQCVAKLAINKNYFSSSGGGSSMKEEELFSASSSGGIDFDKYDSISVKREGADAEAAKPLAHFSELFAQLPKYLIDNVTRMRYQRPTPIQKHAIPIIMSGRDVLCAAQTGSGKTFAFLLPLLASLEEKKKLPIPDKIKTPARPKILVLAPTRELAIQIHLESLKLTFNSHVSSRGGNPLKCVCVYGGANAKDQLSSMAGGCDLLVATPGRLTDFLDRDLVYLGDCHNLVLDEADRMLDMGFKPQIERIMRSGNLPARENRKTMMFSATFPREIQELARNYMRPYIFVAVGNVGSTTDSITQRFVLVEDTSRLAKSALLEELIAESKYSNSGRKVEPTIVFTTKKKTATQVKAYLNKADPSYSAVDIHGDRNQHQREEALRLFRSGEASVLVATDVAARGLDIPHVTHVINFDLPTSVEEFDTYIHRIGRTGRAGKVGRATSFFIQGFDPKSGNSALIPHFEKLLRESNQEIPDFFRARQGSSSSSSSSTRSSIINNNSNGNNNNSKNSNNSNAKKTKEITRAESSSTSSSDDDDEEEEEISSKGRTNRSQNQNQNQNQNQKSSTKGSHNQQQDNYSNINSNSSNKAKSAGTSTSATSTSAIESKSSNARNALASNKIEQSTANEVRNNNNNKKLAPGMSTAARQLWQPDRHSAGAGTSTGITPVSSASGSAHAHAYAPVGRSEQELLLHIEVDRLISVEKAKLAADEKANQERAKLIAQGRVNPIGQSSFISSYSNNSNNSSGSSNNSNNNSSTSSSLDFLFGIQPVPVQQPKIKIIMSPSPFDQIQPLNMHNPIANPISASLFDSTPSSTSSSLFSLSSSTSSSSTSWTTDVGKKDDGRESTRNEVNNNNDTIVGGGNKNNSITPPHPPPITANLEKNNSLKPASSSSSSSSNSSRSISTSANTATAISIKRTNERNNTTSVSASTPSLSSSLSMSPVVKEAIKIVPLVSLGLPDPNAIAIVNANSSSNANANSSSNNNANSNTSSCSNINNNNNNNNTTTKAISQHNSTSSSIGTNSKQSAIIVTPAPAPVPAPAIVPDSIVKSASKPASTNGGGGSTGTIINSSSHTTIIDDSFAVYVPMKSSRQKSENAIQLQLPPTANASTTSATSITSASSTSTNATTNAVNAITSTRAASTVGKASTEPRGRGANSATSTTSANVKTETNSKVPKRESAVIATATITASAVMESKPPSSATNRPCSSSSSEQASSSSSTLATAVSACSNTTTSTTFATATATTSSAAVTSSKKDEADVDDNDDDETSSPGRTCRFFAKTGYCSNGDKCTYLHVDENIMKDLVFITSGKANTYVNNNPNKIKKQNAATATTTTTATPGGSSQQGSYSSSDLSTSRSSSSRTVLQEHIDSSIATDTKCVNTSVINQSSTVASELPTGTEKIAINSNNININSNVNMKTATTTSSSSSSSSSSSAAAEGKALVVLPDNLNTDLFRSVAGSVGMSLEKMAGALRINNAPFYDRYYSTHQLKQMAQVLVATNSFYQANPSKIPAKWSKSTVLDFIVVLVEEAKLHGRVVSNFNLSTWDKLRGSSPN